jgi:hypothetical protein
MGNVACDRKNAIFPFGERSYMFTDKPGSSDGAGNYLHVCRREVLYDLLLRIRRDGQDCVCPGYRPRDQEAAKFVIHPLSEVGHPESLKKNEIV